MMDPSKFGGGGSFAAYMDRRRRGVALHYQRKYAQEAIHSEDEDEDTGSDREYVDALDYDNNIPSPEDDGLHFSEHGKVRKLQSPKIPKTQKNSSIARKNDNKIITSLFHGCHFYIDGVVSAYEPLLAVEPCEDAALHAHETLVKLIVRHGGMIEIHLSEYVTHYVAERVALGCDKWWNIRQRGGYCRQYAVVTPAYVFECHLQNRRLNERDFLPEMLKLRRDTVTLTQLWKPHIKRGDAVLSAEADAAAKAKKPYEHEESNDINVISVADSNDEAMYDKSQEDDDDSSRKYTRDTDNVTSTTLQMSSNSDKTENKNGNGLEGAKNVQWAGDTAVEREQSLTESTMGPDVKKTSVPSPIDGDSSKLTKEKEKDKQAKAEVLDTFGVEEYYKHSRLHLLGTWKTNVEKEFDFEPFRPLKEGILRDGYILHVDMDAFFVSVALRDKPHLRTMPIAISHGTGRTSASEIATCNYAARRFGVRKGMWVKEALSRCPSLRFVGYDFDAITSTATKILRLIANTTQRVYSASCDEHYLECFLGREKQGTEEYIKFAEELSKMIEKETGCPLSVGIGGNMMLAKLASQKCKAMKHGMEDSALGCVKRSNVCAVVDVEAFMSSVSLQELPGVGDRAMSILSSCGYLRCRDVSSKEELQLLLGDKVGETVFQFCQGLDFRDICSAEKRSQCLKNRTISSAINYGVRIRCMEQVYEYMKQLVNQTWERVAIVMRQLQSNGATIIEKEVLQAKIMLKLKVRAPTASVEPEKYMGCGLCDELSASVDGYLYSQISVFKSLLECWERIVDKRPILLEDLRGIAIGIFRIKKAQEEEKNTLDKFLVTKAQKQEAASYPYIRTGGSKPQTPARRLPEPFKVGTPKEGSSILRFMETSPMARNSGSKRKRPKARAQKMYTLFDMRYLQSPARTRTSLSLEGSNRRVTKKHDSHTDRHKAIGQAAASIIDIIPSVSTVWLYRATVDIIENRLKAIESAWPMYKGVVLFYRKIFENYSSIVNDTVEEEVQLCENTHRSSETFTPSMGICTDTIEHAYITDEEDYMNYQNYSDTKGQEDTGIGYEEACSMLTQRSLLSNSAKEPSRDNVATEEQVQKRGQQDLRGQVDTRGHVEHGGYVEQREPAEQRENLDTKEQVATNVVTLFAMRRICRSCRSRFYKEFEISMIQETHCSSPCVLPRLLSMERSIAGKDCTGKAATMVICTLVYVTILRTVIELAKKRRMDLLQSFVDISMQEAMNFSLSFLPGFDSSVQNSFFTEARTHLLHINNIADTRRS